MQIHFYSFPMEDDGLVAIEKMLRELEQKERTSKLAQEEIDWVQYAERLLYNASADIIPEL